MHEWCIALFWSKPITAFYKKIVSLKIVHLWNMVLDYVL